jgi:mannosyltransferase
LYPSSYEGFGIPVVESMMAGCPVVAVNKSSIPEIAGDAALLVNEITVDAFCQEIKKLEDPIFRRELVRKGKKNANRFSWDICFEKTYAVYKELLRDI